MSKIRQSGRLLKIDFAHLVVGVLVFGAVWGMSEVALGGVLGAVNFPFRAGLLTGIGMGILSLACVLYKNCLILSGIGLVTAMVSLISVPVLHLTVMCKANSLIAIMTEAVSLSLIAAVLMHKNNGNVYLRMAGGAAAAILASTGFYLIGTHVAPCKYLSSFSGLGAFLVREGLIWAAFAAILVPLGYLAGEKLASRFPVVNAGRSIAYYAGASGIFAASLAISYLAIIAGF